MDIAKRFAHNPLLRPEQVKPSLAGLEVTCLLNPGAFRYRGRTGLLMRVAERQIQRDGYVGTPVADETAPGGLRLLEFRRGDPLLKGDDPRVFTYAGEAYLTTLSHLRLAWSEDGEHFTADEKPTLLGVGPLERFGVEDCRVTQVGEDYLLTFTEVSEFGVGVGLITTRDWTHFNRRGMIIPPHNKDCAIFERQVGGQYVCLHRPSGCGIGGNFIWLATSPDLVHWGEHTCIARTRPGAWDSERIGAGAAPIWTERGWLEIYHGADTSSRYALGALLLDLADPTQVLARSKTPIMEPVSVYEQKGFFGNCVFTNGHVVDGDRVTLYYGASDTVICGAVLSIQDILASL